MYQVKICGIRREEDVCELNRLCPEYAGFVFAQSRRQVSPKQAAALRKLLRPDIRAIGVFVNEEPEQTAQAAELAGMDMIQLHGDEDETYIKKLRTLTHKPLIKAIRVQSREQILEAEKLPCDYLLLDTYTPGQYGGSGRTFDRSLIPALGKPFFLAGGLNCENVSAALKESGAFGADVSSAVETDGWKDKEKMAAFIRAVREM